MAHPYNNRQQHNDSSCDNAGKYLPPVGRFLRRWGYWGSWITLRS